MFDSHFEIILADTDESRRFHYRLRYQVYCLETGFEDPAAYPDGEEKDEYDDSAVPFLVRKRGSDNWIAAMRLVLSAEHRPFPAETVCDLRSTRIETMDKRQVIEFSRLCISKDYRRRGREHTVPYEVIDGATGSRKPVKSDRRHQPEIMLSLIQATLVWTREHDFRHCLFLITPALARILIRQHVPLVSLHPPCHHRGSMRIPYIVDLEDTRARMTRGSEHFKAMMRQPAYQLYSAMVAGGRSGSFTAATNGN